MQIDPSEVTIGERQRKEFSRQELDTLKNSIVSKGLLHPIVVTEQKVLVAGERRLRVIKELHEEGQLFKHNGIDVELNFVPIVYVSDLSEADIQEAELEENLLRAALSWQEEALAKSKIHDLRTRTNPSQTTKQTAAEIVQKRGTGTVGSEAVTLARSKIVSANMENPRVKNAKNMREAYNNVLEESESLFKARLVEITKITPKDSRIIHGDCLLELPKLHSNTVNVILSDPPYGIDADMMKKSELHLYDDSKETALNVCEFIIREGFRLTKPQAILFMFCDFTHFNHLYTYACQQAWVPWRSPIIWRKGNDGHAPWGRAGFIRTYETILFAVKGQKELVLPGGPDIIDFKRPARNERKHAAEKPVELLEYLLSISTVAGDTVLDPCCGSGPIITAALKKQLKVIAIEKDKSYHAEALSRLYPENDDGEIPFL